MGEPFGCYWFESEGCPIILADQIRKALRDEAEGLVLTDNLDRFLTDISDEIALVTGLTVQMCKAFWHPTMLTRCYEGENGFGGYKLEEGHFAIQAIRRYQWGFLHIELCIKLLWS
jgi:hypothetical protein